MTGGAAETIVLGYDATESARRALERTAELAPALRARVVVVTVAEPRAGLVEPVIAPTMPGAPATTPPGELAPVAADAHRDGASLGEQARALLVERGVDAEVVPASGDPADEIVEVAASCGATLVVVGTRDPGLVSRLLGHSVSDRVVRGARCDVLVVR